MKKKLALLLAAVMTLSALPTMGLFAASTNDFENLSVPPKTIAAQGVAKSWYVNNSDLDVEYVTETNNFKAKMGDTSSLEVGKQITATLSSNAEWFFVKPTGTNASDVGFTSTFKEYVDVANIVPDAPADLATLLTAIDNAFAAIAALDAGVAVPADVTTQTAAITAAIATFDEPTLFAGVTSSKYAKISAYITKVEAAVTAIDNAVLTDVAAAKTVAATQKTTLDDYVAGVEAEAAALAVTNTGISFVYDDAYIDTSETGYHSYRKLTAMNTAGEELYTIVSEKYLPSVATITIIKRVAGGQVFELPVIFRSNDSEEDITLKMTESEISNALTTISSSAKGTKTIVNKVNSGRDMIEIDDIVISETVPGAIKNDGYTTLEISDDFRWDASKLKFAFSSQFASMDQAKAGDNWWLNAKGNKLTVKFSNLVRASTKNKGSVILTGLIVEPQDDNDSYYGTDIKLKIKEVSSYDYSVSGVDATEKDVTKSGVKEETGILIGSFKDYGIKIGFDSTGKLNEAYSGKKEVKAGVKGDDVAKIVFEEITSKSWWAQRALEFTLTDEDGKVLDDVKFVSFNITDKSNVAFKDEKFENIVNKDRNKVSLTAKEAITADKLGKIKFEVLFNVSANFVGDVYLTAGGKALQESDIVSERFKVATITAPIKVTAKATNVAIGYQSYSVGDITVTETAAGVLAKDKALTLEVREFAELTKASSSTDISFNPLKSDSVVVTSGDLTIDKVELLTGGAISVKIKRASTTASAITLSGLQIRINRSVPYGTYDLVVGGDSWVETYDKDGTAPKFDVDGLVSKDYIAVATEPSVVTVSQNVVVLVGTTTALVDEKEVDMGISTYIDPASNRTMLPLRAVSMLFKISDSNVIWDSVSGKATIIVGDRIVTFTNGSSKMTINGVEVDMVDENGVAVKAAISPETNRMYIPLRQLGLAYGVEVLWINSTPGQAIFNPTAAQKEEAANTSSSVAPTTTTDEAETETTNATTDTTVTDTTGTDTTGTDTGATA